MLSRHWRYSRRFLLEPPARSHSEDARSHDRGRGRGVDAAAGEWASVVGVGASGDLRRDLTQDGVDVQRIEHVEHPFNRMTVADLEDLRNAVVPHFDPRVTGNLSFDRNADVGVQRIPELDK